MIIDIDIKEYNDDVNMYQSTYSKKYVFRILIFLRKIFLSFFEIYF